LRTWNLVQKSFAALSLGVALGLAVSFFLLETGFGFNQLKAGPWVAWPRTGTSELDPYTLAKLSFFNEIPLGAAEGLKFIATSSSSGAPLTGKCDYKVSGGLPQARFWTLDIYSRDGKPLAGESNRPGLSSAELLRPSEGGFEIVLSRNARPGNWLSLPNDGRFCLALTLYDVETSGGASRLPSEEMPSITQARCQ
jgi:hypothetical protein